MKQEAIMVADVTVLLNRGPMKLGIARLYKTEPIKSGLQPIAPAV